MKAERREITFETMREWCPESERTGRGRLCSKHDIRFGTRCTAKNCPRWKRMTKSVLSHSDGVEGLDGQVYGSTPRTTVAPIKDDK